MHALVKAKESVEDLLTLLCQNPELDVNGKDMEGMIPLHLACMHNSVHVVQGLLKRDAKVDILNEEGFPPFYYVKSQAIEVLLSDAGATDPLDRDPQLTDDAIHRCDTEYAVYLVKHSKHVKKDYLKEAVKRNYKDLAQALAEHEEWADIFRHKFDFTTPDNTSVKTTPFRECIKKMPDVAEYILNKCIHPNPTKDNPGDKYYSILFDYEFIEDLQFNALGKNQQNASHKCEYQDIKDRVPMGNYSSPWGPAKFSAKNHALSLMVEYKRTGLLSHPVVGSLLHHKWIKFGQYFYYINLLFYSIFLTLLTTFALILPSPQDLQCLNASSENSNTIFTDDIVCSSNVGLYILTILIICSCILRFAIEAIQMYNEGFNYFKRFSNYIEQILIWTSIIFAVCVFHSNCFCPLRWQWQVGIIAVFLGWINLIVFISKLPLTGIYVLMFIKISKTILKIVILAALLIVAFGLTLFMALDEEAIMRSPFSTPFRSLVKLISMTAGDFEFDSIFRLSPDAESDMATEIPFVEVSYILWITFIILMPILLTNMLVGLAVGDIEAVQKETSLQKLELQVEQVLYVEEFLRRLKKNFSIGWNEVWPNSPIPTITPWLRKSHKLWSFFQETGYKFQIILWGGESYDKVNVEKILHPTKERMATQIEEMEKQLLQNRASSTMKCHCA